MIRWLLLLLILLTPLPAMSLGYNPGHHGPRGVHIPGGGGGGGGSCSNSLNFGAACNSAFLVVIIS